MTKTAELNGVKFYVVESSVNESVSTQYVGSVTIKAFFNIRDTWDDVVKRLDGIVLNKGGDLQTEIIALLQDQVDILESRVAQQSTEDRERAQHAEASATHAEQRAVRAEQHVQLLQAQLEMRARERDRALDDVNKWAVWYGNHAGICPLGQG